MNRADIPIIIQATYRSRLFEGKSTACIRDDTTVLAYLVDRIRNRWPGRIILATSE